MGAPDVSEFDSIKEIILKAQGLSPASVRYVRARLLEVLKEKGTVVAAILAPDVTEAQKKTEALFRKKAEGE